MSDWRRTLDAAQRRTAAQAAVSGVARALPFTAGAALCWVAVATAMEWPVRWPLVAGAGAASIAVAGIVAWMKRPSPLVVAAGLDEQADSHNAIGTALELSFRSNVTAMEAWAVSAAEQAAARAEPGRAFPWRLKRPAAAAGLAAAMLVGAAFIPQRWPVRAAQVAGLSGGPRPTKADVQRSLADATAAERLIKAVQEPPRSGAVKDLSAPSVAGDPLAELKRQLERGDISPKEATQQAATAVERAADRIERQALEAQQATDVLRERLAMANEPPLSQGGADAGESALTRALREGNFDKAAAEAEKLAGGAEHLSPKERANLAQELRGIADDLKKPPAEPGPKPDPAERRQGDQRAGEEPAGDAPSRTADRQPTSAHQAGSRDATNSTGDDARRRAERQAGNLADTLDKAAEELNNAPSSPPPKASQQGQQRPSGADRTPSRRDEQGKGEDGDGSTPSRTDRPADERGSQDRPKPESHGEQPRSANNPPRPDGSHAQPTPARSDEAPSANSPGSQNESGRQQAGDTPHAGQRPAERPSLAETPKPGGATQQEDRSSRPEAQPPTGQPSPRDNPLSGERPQPGPARPDADDPPTAPPDKLPPLDRLREQLKEIADRPRDAARRRQDAQKLREQAQKLWENATPEQRREIEQAARELARGHQDNRGEEKPGSPARGTEEGLSPGAGGAPGDEPVVAKPAAQPMNARGNVHDIDARGSGSDQAPSRVIAQWLSNRPAPTTAHAGPPREVADAVKQQQQSAEQAVQQRSVPSRLGPLVRRYFDRLPGALGAAPSAAAPPEPVPTPASPGPTHP